MKSGWILTFTIMILLVASFVYSAEVKNERVRQDGNRVVFEYDLEGDKEAEVSVTITIDGRQYATKELHLEGDFGNVKPGRGKKVYWNILQDFPRGLNGYYEASIEAARREIAGMVFIKGGCFDMGNSFGDGNANEKPVHQVCVDDFYMGKYEVTQREWMDVMESNPSHFKNCDTCPVDSINWNVAQDFIRRLNKKTGHRHRLPTEAEWEYAARSGGEREKWAGTSSEYELGDYAWNNKNSGRTTHPVGQLKPNGLGLYDMSGNVWEWAEDWYAVNYYRESPKDNPTGPRSGEARVHRGGSWSDAPSYMSISTRGACFPIGNNCLGRSLTYFGLRVVRTK